MIQEGSATGGKCYRREVLQERSATRGQVQEGTVTGGKCYRREVLQERSATGGNFYRREVLQEGSATGGKCYRREVLQPSPTRGFKLVFKHRSSLNPIPFEAISVDEGDGLLIYLGDIPRFLYWVIAATLFNVHTQVQQRVSIRAAVIAHRLVYRETN